jgi:endonuclease/exonuclease/phosphatase family metal-dependent hydrolase
MELNVVSFNIWCHDQPGKNSVNSRAPRLKEVLDPIDADIIGLQECTPNWLTHLEEDFSSKYEIFNVWRASHNHESTPILWRKDKFICLDKGNFWLSDTPEVESEGWCEWKCNRICTWAKLQDKITGEIFLLMNTHFGFGDEGQVSSARLIAERYAQLGEGLPMVITGDFNLRPTAPAYAAMCAHFTDDGSSVKSIFLYQPYFSLAFLSSFSESGTTVSGSPTYSSASLAKP